MPKFKLFAGMGGGFGGPHYHETLEYETRDEAMEDAYQLAVEDYQSYEGCHGVMSWGDVYEDLLENGWFEGMTESEINEMVDDQYQQEVEGWITYNAIPVLPGEKEIDEGYTDYPSVNNISLY